MSIRTSYPAALLRPILVVLLALLILILLEAASTVEASQISPPTNVTVVPLPEGGSLNISWNPEGTNASNFKIYLSVNHEYLIPLAIVPVDRSYYIHTGLESGNQYTYLVASLDEDNNPVDPSSSMVTGWPLPPQSTKDPLSPPFVHSFSPFTNVRSIIVSGTAAHPGSSIGIERVQTQQWETFNVMVKSSPVTGWFSTVIDLCEGENLIHARVEDPAIGTGRWSPALYTFLDVESPTIVLNGTMGPFEVGDPVVLSAEGSYDDLGIESIEWLCRWQSEYELAIRGSFYSFVPYNEGCYNLTLILTDYAGNQAIRNISLPIRKKGIPPSLYDLPNHIRVTCGEEYIFEMTKWVEDLDDSENDLVWYVNDGNSSLFTSSIVGSHLTLATTGAETGVADLYIRVVDSTGRSDEGVIVVTVETANKDGDGFQWSIVQVLAFSIGLPAMVLVVRRYRVASDDAEEVDGAFYIKSVYVVHVDGRLMLAKHCCDNELKDSDIISSMFTAIQDFVADAFISSASLENIKFGENHLTISHGRNIFMVSLSYGPVDAEFLERARDVVRHIEARFTGIIEDWDGNRAWLNGMEDIMSPLFQNNEAQSLEDVIMEYKPSSLSAVASIDFRHGFVVYTAEICNRTDEIVVDPYLDIRWDKEVLHLTKYMPENSRTEGRFRLDNLHPGECATVTLFFDPQVCLESFINGSLTTMDIQGKLNTLYLEKTLVDVNCPIFFTPGNANTAMLRKLIEDELEFVDSKIYNFSLVLNTKDVYKIAKAAASSYDIKFVMDYSSEDPFVGEAWFYGETKIKGHKVVVRVTVCEANSSVEFLAASSIQMVLTGLLAELGQVFLRKMDEKYTHGYNLNRVVKRFVQQNLALGPLSDGEQTVRELLDGLDAREDMTLTKSGMDG